MGNSIGFVTNTNTSMYCLQSEYSEESLENKILNERLIVTRKIQGTEIDKAKGFATKAIPNWSKFYLFLKMEKLKKKK